VTLDGQRQRNALTAAEKAPAALAAGDGERARINAAKAADLDQIGVYAGLPDAVAAAANDVAGGGAIGADARSRLRSAVPPGPLHALVDALGS
jgi:hypothetical protein